MTAAKKQAAGKQATKKQTERKPAERKLAETKHIDRKALARHKKRFLFFFPEAYEDQQYIDWERTYKWEAHKRWKEILNQEEFETLMRKREYLEIGNRALKVEAMCNFLFSFEKMAIKDAVRTPHGARIFSEGLYQLLHGKGTKMEKFVQWIMSVAELPRIKSRVLSWPVLTFFPFIAQPSKHIIMKPSAMRAAAAELGYDLEYSSKPNYKTYENLMTLADMCGEYIADLHPKDYHDLQSFLWCIGSPEYERIEAEMKGEEY